MVPDYSHLPWLELVDDELGCYMDCMASCRCFICSIAWCGKNDAKEILVLGILLYKSLKYVIDDNIEINMLKYVTCNNLMYI